MAVGGLSPVKDGIPGLIADDANTRYANGDVVGCAEVAIVAVDPVVPNLQWKIRSGQKRGGNGIRERAAFTRAVARAYSCAPESASVRATRRSPNRQCQHCQQKAEARSSARRWVARELAPGHRPDNSRRSSRGPARSRNTQQ